VVLSGAEWSCFLPLQSGCSSAGKLLPLSNNVVTEEPSSTELYALTPDILLFIASWPSRLVRSVLTPRPNSSVSIVAGYKWSTQQSTCHFSKAVRPTSAPGQPPTECGIGGPVSLGKAATTVYCGEAYVYRLCSLMVTVPACGPRGPGFESRGYQMF
jgi:hypothetical protein